MIAYLGKIIVFFFKQYNLNNLFNSGATSQACDFTPAFFDRPLTNRELGVFIESTMVDQTFVKELKDQLKKMKGFAYEEYSYISMYFWNN